MCCFLFGKLIGWKGSRTKWLPSLRKPSASLCFFFHLLSSILSPALLHSLLPHPFLQEKMKMFRSRQGCHIGVGGGYGPSVSFRPLRGWSPAAFGHLPPLLGFLSFLAPSSHHCWVSGLGSRPEAGCVAPRLADWCSRFH